MKKLFRDRKLSIDTKTKPVVVSAPAPLAPSAPDTPLYSRFASSSRNHDAPTKPAVSGPMQLSSRMSFNRGHSGGTGRGNGNQEKVLSRMPSRKEQIAAQPKVLETPPTRSASRVKMSTVAVSEPPSASTSTFPRTESYDSRNTSQDKFSFPSTTTASTSRIQLPEAISRPDSIGSDSYIAPPRPLVVRNADPETASSTSVSEVATTKASSAPRPPAHIPTSAQYTRHHQTGHDPGTQQASSSNPPRSGPSASASALRETPLSTPSTADSNDRHLGAGTQMSPRHGSWTQHPSPPPKSSVNLPHAPISTPSHAPAPAASTLLATPSITRRKYSPLAAFGLPVAQTNSGASSTPSSTHPEPAPAHDLNPPIHVQGVEQPVSSNAPLQNDSSADDSPERPSVSSSSPSLPPLPDNIPPEEQTNTPPPSPPQLHPQPQRQSVHEPVDTEPRSQAPSLPNQSYRAPATPLNDPPTYQPQSSARPTPQPLQASPEMFRSSKDRFERPPPSPTKSRGTRLHKQNHREQEGVSRSYESGRSMAQSSPSTPPAAPVRGKPLIFAAMASTPDELPDNQPTRVDMSVRTSVDAKVEHRYSAYATRGAQQQTPPPDPIPELRPDSSPKRKKLSKLHKTSSRKPEPASAEMSQMAHSYTMGSSSHRSPEPSGTSASHTHHRGTSVPVVPVDPRAPGQDGLERYATDANRQSRRKSMAVDGKLQKRPKDGVKHLTDKQMEKLNHRVSYAGPAPAQREQQPPSSRKSFVEEYPVSQPTQTTHHRTSQAYPSPASSQGMHHMLPQSPQGSHHSQYMASLPPQGSRHTQYAPPNQLPPAQWSNQVPKRQSPMQLPTPPEEYNPIPLPKVRRDPSPQKPSPPPPLDAEDMEVSAPMPPRRGHRSPELPPAPTDAEEPMEPTSFPLVSFLSNPVLLENLLAYLSYFDWARLARVSKDVRRVLYEEGKEQVLGRYLSTVGYSKWVWRDPEPLILTVEDLCYYMHGVSTASHRFKQIATDFFDPNPSSNVDAHTMKQLTYACRAFTRVVLRLRAQAEAEAAHNARMAAMSPYPDSAPRQRTGSFSSQRPTKWSSQTSLNYGGSRVPSRAPSPAPSRAPSTQRTVHAERSMNTFQSPLFRLRRAPLLQVFVPSPEGDWLSDTNVLECEAELKRAGVLHLLRAGDVVWDAAVGDEANVGRMVWDGSYLIDLDYTYSRVGDPPRYLPSLAFPPSYFHRVIRTMGTGNPVVRIDLAPWASQIHENVQLLTEKMRMETPQGGKHTVIRWVHRSSFTIRPAPGSKSIRLPMPQTAGPGPSPTGAWIIDPGWFGTVMVETEGTNEGLDDLHRRCKGPLPLRRGQQMTPEEAAAEEQRTTFRILREKSRPGEIWIRVVTAKERIIPL